MTVIDILIIFIIVSIQIAVFISGIFIGKNMCINSRDSQSLYSHKLKSKELSKIDIDERKVVSSIPTDNLEKKFDQITDEIETQTDISTSINKLKNIKKH